MKFFNLIQFSITCILIVVSCFHNISHAAQFTSNVANGNWNASGSWTFINPDADGLPDANDTVTVLSGHTIRWGVLTTSHTITDININVGGTLRGPANVTYAMNVNGNYVNNGSEAGRGLFLFGGSGTSISGSGTFVNNNQWVFNTTRTIAADVDVEKVYWTRLYAGSSVINEGNLTLRSLIAYNAASSFTNRGTVTLRSSDFMAVGSFDASFAGNTVIIDWKSGASGSVIPEPISNFHNLRIASIATDNDITYNLDVNGDLTLDFDVIFDMGGFDLNLAGDYDDSGSDEIINYSSITFDGSGVQNIDIDNATGGADASQWDCDVTINSGSVTNLNSTLRINDLVIDGDLVISPANDDLELLGNWTNNGTFSPSMGRVFFMGTTAQTLNGTGTTQFYHVNFENSAGATFTSGAYELIAQLRVNSGTVNAGSNLLTVISDASFTGSIRNICSSCLLTGTITMQRFVPGGNADYRDVSCPFPGGITFTQWDDDMLISCPSCPDGCAYGGGCFVSIKSFDAASDSYVDIAGITAPILNGVGYEAFFGDDLSTFSGTTLTTSGTVNTPANVVKTMTAGWNLVGNPYCSDIDFDGIIVGSNVSDYYYIYDNSTGFYEYYDASGVTVPANSGSITANGHIASSQGFWVEASNGGAFSRQVHFLQAAKRGSGEALVKSTQGNLNPQFFIKISNKVNGTSCKSKLVLLPEALEELDTFDIPLFRGPDHPVARKSPILCFNADNNFNRMNAVDLNTNLIVRKFDLMFNSEISGRFEISANSLEMFNEYNCVLLYDKEEEKYTNLRMNSYTFDYDGSLDDSDRFQLILSNESMCDIFLADDNSTKEDVYSSEIATAQLAGGTIHVSVSVGNNQADTDEDGIYSVTIHNMFGQIVHKGDYSGREFNINETIATGTYILTVRNSNEQLNTKMIVY